MISPEPWELSPEGEIIYAANGLPVAFKPRFNETNGDMRLMCAAPRLLTELRSVISAYGDKTWGTAYAMNRALSSARALLAEIEGGGQ